MLILIIMELLLTLDLHLMKIGIQLIFQLISQPTTFYLLVTRTVQSHDVWCWKPFWWKEKCVARPYSRSAGKMNHINHFEQASRHSSPATAFGCSGAPHACIMSCISLLSVTQNLPVEPHPFAISSHSRKNKNHPTNMSKKPQINSKPPEHPFFLPHIAPLQHIVLSLSHTKAKELLSKTEMGRESQTNGRKNNSAFPQRKKGVRYRAKGDRQKKSAHIQGRMDHIII